ncbi:MAG: thiamine phosphate synthase [Bacteroidota bacterium]
MFSKLQYISQGITAHEQHVNIQSALDAGCNWIQLRFKNPEPKVLMPLAAQIRNLCDSYSAILIINDHPVVAHEVDAHGVHLGLNDMKITDAKKIVGANKIIGGTANTLDDVMRRHEEGCSYIGLGPFRFTRTKEKLSPVLGLNGIWKIMSELVARKIEIPVYAIGGIVLEDAKAILQTGVWGIAVSGVITQSADRKKLVFQFNSLLYEAVDNSQ